MMECSTPFFAICALGNTLEGEQRNEHRKFYANLSAEDQKKYLALLTERSKDLPYKLINGMPTPTDAALAHKILAELHSQFASEASQP